MGFLILHMAIHNTASGDEPGDNFSALLYKDRFLVYAEGEVYDEEWNKFKKIPYDPETLRPEEDASYPSQLVSYREAEKLLRSNSYLHGIGLVVEKGDERVLVDLDRVLDRETGKICCQYAEEFLEDFPSLTLRTPSGTGLRVCLEGHLESNGKKFAWTDREENEHKFEVHGSDCWVTFPDNRDDVYKDFPILEARNREQYLDLTKRSILSLLGTKSLNQTPYLTCDFTKRTAVLQVGQHRKEFDFWKDKLDVQPVDLPQLHVFCELLKDVDREGKDLGQIYQELDEEVISRIIERLDEALAPGETNPLSPYFFEDIEFLHEIDGYLAQETYDKVILCAIRYLASLIEMPQEQVDIEILMFWVHIS